MTVSFHGSFGLRRSHLAGLLKRALENPKMGDKELAKPFGYGAPFASKYRSWLCKTALTERGFPVRSTPVGEVVIKHGSSGGRPLRAGELGSKP